MESKKDFYVHDSALVEDGVQIGSGTKIWHDCQIRSGARLGKNCILGKGIFVDSDVVIGDNVKIQNYVSVYHGVTIDNGVFIGPHVCFTNDLLPRAVNKDGSPKQADDWNVSPIHVGEGASLGANSTIRCGIDIGAWAMVGAGSVVTRDVPVQGLVFGNPARLQGFVCKCGAKLVKLTPVTNEIYYQCPHCHEQYLYKEME